MSAVALSVRTAAEPMAFTAGEFWRGALSAWLWFLGLSTLGFLPWLFMALHIVLLYTVPWSIAGMLIGLAPAFGLGRALRRVASVPVHIVVFTVFGAALGVGMTTIALAVMGGGYGGSAVFWLVPIVASVAAVPLGWLRGSRDARRTAGGRVRHPSVDPDAAYEDSL
jgi:hypothetical protein